MKKLMVMVTIVIISQLYLLGCTSNGKSAEQHGNGISVEIGDIDNISYLALNVYMDGLYFSNNFIYNENGSFDKGQIIWFDAPVSDSKYTQEIEVIYSNNPDGSNSTTTNMIDITSAEKWVHTKLNNDLYLELLKFK